MKRNLGLERACTKSRGGVHKRRRKQERLQLAMYTGIIDTHYKGGEFKYFLPGNENEVVFSVSRGGDVRLLIAIFWSQQNSAQGDEHWGEELSNLEMQMGPQVYKCEI